MDNLIKFLLQYMTTEQFQTISLIGIFVIAFSIIIWIIYDISKGTKENKIFRQDLKVGDTCEFYERSGKIIEINKTNNTVKIEKIINIKDIFKK